MLRVYNEVNLYFHPIYVLEEDRQWSMELSEVTGDVYLDDIDLVLPWLVMSSNEPSNSDNENNDQLKRFESNQKQFQFHTREKP